jgi:hypothetical protein
MGRWPSEPPRWWSSGSWLTLAGWMGIVPADFVMSRQMLRGVKARVERAARSTTGSSGASADHGAGLVQEGAPEEPPLEPAGEGRRPVDLDLP